MQELIPTEDKVSETGIEYFLWSFFNCPAAQNEFQ